MKLKLLEEKLGQARSRGEVKALGRLVDHDPDARAAAETLASARGLGDVRDLDGRRLVRVLLDRADAAQQRSNPIRRDEAFDCVHCGAAVSIGGARVRDHCPRCLRSIHVDVVPGDRASDCGGVLDPVDFTIEGRAGVVIHYRCRTCGCAHRNRAHDDDLLPPGLHAPGQAP